MNLFLRNIPNLTHGAAAVASAPMLAGALPMRGDYRWALVIFGFTGLSDAADGWLAKRFHP